MHGATLAVRSNDPTVFSVELPESERVRFSNYRVTLRGTGPGAGARPPGPADPRCSSLQYTIEDIPRPARLRIVTLLAAFISILVLRGRAEAEPWFAVQQGFKKCSQCHVNGPAGGGMRNTFGQVWGQTAPARGSAHLDDG